MHEPSDLKYETLETLSAACDDLLRLAKIFHKRDQMSRKQP